MSLVGCQVLVTGATGFIGGRLVETLIQEHKCRVRALIHNFTNASRIARFRLEMIPGDINDEVAVEKAAKGCDVVIHAAMGTTGNADTRRRATVEGTETVLRVALNAGVNRVVHISTISVYGMTPDGDLDENSPRGALLDDYGRNKADAEKLALDYYRSKGLAVAVIQPTIVYGPFASSWTIAPIMSLRTEQVVLPDDGNGLCNAVYIDDVVDAIIRAAYVPEAAGECFLISASAPVTWREFYGAYENMLGFHSTVGMTEAQLFEEMREYPWQDFKREILSFFRHPKVWRRFHSTFLLRWPYQAVKAITPRTVRQKLVPTSEVLTTRLVGGENSKPRVLPDFERFKWMCAKMRVRIDKARRILGYNPQFDLQSGMLRTRLWAKWAALLDECGERT